MLNLCLILLIGVYAVLSGIALRFMLERPRSRLTWLLVVTTLPVFALLVYVFNNPVL
jgi:hypothetical protein